jgi:hypothetical protein
MKNTTTKLIQDLTFNRLLINLVIEPVTLFDIDVIDYEIVKPESNVEHFYKWLQRCRNIHLSDNTQVVNSFLKIENYK